MSMKLDNIRRQTKETSSNGGYTACFSLAGNVCGAFPPQGAGCDHSWR